MRNVPHNLIVSYFYMIVNKTDKKWEMFHHTPCFGKIFEGVFQYLTRTFWANWRKTNIDISSKIFQNFFILQNINWDLLDFFSEFFYSLENKQRFPLEFSFPRNEWIRINEKFTDVDIICWNYLNSSFFNNFFTL